MHDALSINLVTDEQNRRIAETNEREQGRVLSFVRKQVLDDGGGRRTIMAHRICPWWLGYLLANPLRRLVQNPADVIAPYVREGMTVLEPGPGMGFFTLEIARRVGSRGRVVAVDIQPRMLASLKRRAARAGLQNRVETRLATPAGLGLEDLPGTIDFTLAFALVHELPSAESFFREIAKASKAGAEMLFAEPSGHVDMEHFQAEVQVAVAAGFQLTSSPEIRRSHSALMKMRAPEGA